MDKLRKLGFVNLFLLTTICLSTCLAIYFFKQKNVQQFVIQIELLVLEVGALTAKFLIDRKYK